MMAAPFQIWNSEQSCGSSGEGSEACLWVRPGEGDELEGRTNREHTQDLKNKSFSDQWPHKEIRGLGKLESYFSF